MATAELELGAADRGAENMHAEHEVGAEPKYAPADRVEQGDRRPVPGFRSRFGLAGGLLDRAEQRLCRRAGTLYARLRTRCRHRDHEALQDPRAGGVDTADLREVERQRPDAALPLQIAQFLVDAGDRRRQPVAAAAHDEQLAAAPGLDARPRVDRLVSGDVRLCGVLADHRSSLSGSDCRCHFSSRPRPTAKE